MIKFIKTIISYFLAKFIYIVKKKLIASLNLSINSKIINLKNKIKSNIIINENEIETKFIFISKKIGGTIGRFLGTSPWYFMSASIFWSYNYYNTLYFYTVTLICFFLSGLFAIYCTESLEHSKGFYWNDLKRKWLVWRQQTFFDKIKLFFFWLILHEYAIFLFAPTSKYIWFPIVICWVWDSLNQFFFYTIENYGVWLVLKHCFQSYFCLIRGIRWRGRVERTMFLLKKTSTEYQFFVFLQLIESATKFYDDTVLLILVIFNIWLVYHIMFVWSLLISSSLPHELIIYY